MLRIGLTCIVWYADAENAIETQFRDNSGIIFAILKFFQTVASKNPPSVWQETLVRFDSVQFFKWQIPNPTVRFQIPVPTDLVPPVPKTHSKS